LAKEEVTRILLTGANGQVGQELQQVLAPNYELIGIGRNRLDFAHPEKIEQLVREIQPAIVINTAAYTAVDKAESEPDLAKMVNGDAPEMLAKAVQAVGAALIHLSTDYVFDGKQGSLYLETHPTQPLSSYGRSKLAGEVAIRLYCDLHFILRTAWVYGAYGKSNFVKTMLRLGAEREEVRVVADQIGSPTWARSIATTIHQLILQLSPELAGTYHYTNSGVASWYDFAIAIFEEARLLGFPLKIQRVIPITTTDYPTPAHRPAYSVLSCAKITAVLGSSPPHWRICLRQMLAELAKNQPLA
jgi:dTDP-4-dehydrorhamnose reductase